MSLFHAQCDYVYRFHYGNHYYNSQRWWCSKSFHIPDIFVGCRSTLSVSIPIIHFECNFVPLLIRLCLMMAVSFFIVLHNRPFDGAFDDEQRHETLPTSQAPCAIHIETWEMLEKGKVSKINYLRYSCWSLYRHRIDFFFKGWRRNIAPFSSVCKRGPVLKASIFMVAYERPFWRRADGPSVYFVSESWEWFTASTTNIKEQCASDNGMAALKFTVCVWISRHSRDKNTRVPAFASLEFHDALIVCAFDRQPVAVCARTCGWGKTEFRYEGESVPRGDIAFVCSVFAWN